MATTPPPCERPRTPPAPLYGSKYDNYEPYPPRRSTRLSRNQGKQPARTPSPGREPPIPVPAASSPFVLHTMSPPPSTQPLSRKKGIRGSGFNLNHALADLDDVFTTAPHEEGATAEPTNLPNGRPGLLPYEMLPTPDKTPRKRETKSNGLGPTARVLFPTFPKSVEETMPMPKKGRRGRKANGFSLGGLMKDDEDEDGGVKIEIFTDSKERVPELDASEDNPFYESKEEAAARASSAKPSKPASTRKAKVTRRDDGIVYVFRGKKFFRKFEDMTSSSDEGQGSDSDGFNDSDVRRGASSASAFTRTSLKPRLLFPTEEQLREREEKSKREEVEQDFKAGTDIEDEVEASDKETGKYDNAASTEPIVAPTTPKATARVTRSSAKKAAGNQTPSVSDITTSTPGSSVDSINLSPFDNWRRGKPRRGSPRGKKRHGSPNMSPAMRSPRAGRSGPKRTRGGGFM